MSSSPPHPQGIVWLKYVRFAWSTLRTQGCWSTTCDLVSEVAFDWRYGTRTLVPRDLANLDTTSGSRADGVQYQGANPRIVRELLRQLPQELRSAWFVDFGCGKGRGLLLGREAGFKRLAGVEFAPELADQCRENLTRARGFPPSDTPVIAVQDAAEYPLPTGPIVAFLYNPFRGETLRRVVSRFTQRERSQPGSIWVIYINPCELQEFTQAGWRIDREVRRKGRLMAATLRGMTHSISAQLESQSSTETHNP